MKPALLIPDGVGVRNFLLGGFLKQAEAHAGCHIFHNIPAELLRHYRNGASDRLQWHALLPYREKALPAALRYAINYAHLNWGDTQAMRHVRNQRLSGSWRNRAKHQVSRLVGRVAASPAGIHTLDRWHCSAVERAPEVTHYRRLLEQLEPSIIFCSHQRPPNIIPLVLAARALGIPTVTFIFSWDNLSSKGRIAAPFDHFFVWSELMRQELLTFYPDIAPENVHIVGTPQFDPYADQTLLWTRAEFCARLGADPARPLLCYSGGDTGTAPEDQHHVRILLELIASGQINAARQGRPQVIVRPAPVDDGSRYAAVRRDYPELIFAQPVWLHTTPGEWSRTIPLAEDVQFLANLTEHADLNINLASTMTLDFALHDKPVVNVAFDVSDPPVHGVPLWDYYYQFEHYRPVVRLGAARIARSRAELAQHINEYLADPTLDRAARQQFVELEVGAPLGQSGRMINELLQRLAR